MRFLKLLVIFSFIGGFQNSSFAQTTGSYDTTITFMGQSRTISFLVPANYDPNHNYQLLVGLHGLGDNSSNYRNAVTSWQNLFDSTIFVFPDGGLDANSDFHEPMGDEMVIAESILLAQQVYSINTNEIILQGFSLGGRSALKYGLENPTDFKGLLLNTPALQGLLDLNNEPGGSSLIYNYANASQVPIYVTVGSSDIIYTETNNQLVTRLKKNNGKVEYNFVQGMGHSIPNNTTQGALVEFFKNPETADFDVDLFEIEMEDRTCNSSVSPKIHIQNKGLQNLNGVDIEYNTGGANSTFNWTGNLGLYESVAISLPAISGSGKLVLNATVGMVNGTQVDPNTANDQQDKNFEIVSTPSSLAVFEGFEGNADDWLFDETGSLFEWSIDNSVSRSGQSSLFAFNTLLIFNTLQARENFSSPVVDLSTVSKPTLAFDVAFNYHMYTPPYFTDTVVLGDTLEVLISTDCGATFQSIYKKGGADLATADDPILNPLDISSCFFSPKDSTEWKRERLDLSAFSNSSDAVIRFDYISALGGSISLDNIAIDDASVISEEEEIKELTFEMYPNPASNWLSVNYDYQEVNSLEIYDLKGSLMYSTTLTNSNQITITLDNFKSGLYILKLQGEKGIVAEKLIVE